MHFAFIMLGPFGKNDRAIIKALKKQGVKAIELCGAFGEDGARKIIEATGHEVAVGFVTHFPEDDELFRKAWG